VGASSSASPPRTSSESQPVSAPAPGVATFGVFLFFSNNLGCGGSLLVSAVVTLVLLLLFGVIELG
jgi:hypothetical protein